MGNHAHDTSVTLRTDPFSAFSIGIILQFGWNGENFPYLITSSDGVKGLDKLLNFTAATAQAAAYPYI